MTLLGSLRQCSLCYGEVYYDLIIPVNLTDGSVEDAERYLCRPCGALILEAIARDVRYWDNP